MVQEDWVQKVEKGRMRVDKKQRTFDRGVNYFRDLTTVQVSVNDVSRSGFLITHPGA